MRIPTMARVSRMQIFLNVPASKFALPQIVPTAAILPQGSRGFYARAYRALLPPHAPDMLTVRIQVIDGTGTFTLSDSQPCRLLTLPSRPKSVFPQHLGRCATPRLAGLGPSRALFHWRRPVR